MLMINWGNIQETNETPRMIEIYLNEAWQNAFCYALVAEEGTNEFVGNKLLMTIIGGNDSTLQAMKAAIDLGSSGLSYGYGEKKLTDYEFNRTFRLHAEKGKYEKFPITINNNKKALAIVHDDLLGNSNYILSFEGDPAEDLRQVLGGGKYGLNILPEWKNDVFQEFTRRQFLVDMEHYYDTNLFPEGFHIYNLNMEEEQADDVISEMIQRGTLCFPKKGSGKNLEEIKDLTTYMQTFVNDMIDKVSEKVKPIHNPLTDPIHSRVSSFKRELFPVQSHVSTALAKVLKRQKAALIQGEMSTGKSTMMTAVADIVAAMSNKEGYFTCLMCPPSLTDKWPKEIKEVLPHADVHVIDKTEQLIQFHSSWTKIGRPKPSKPTFFVISFTTMRGDCSTVPAVHFDYKKTSLQKMNQELPYRYGLYCPSCGHAHQVIEDTRTELDDDGNEVQIPVKRTMDEDEFGDSRRLHNSKKPANGFCSECGESLWTKSVPTRYKRIGDWFKHEHQLIHACLDGNSKLAEHIQANQPDIPKKVGSPRRLATIEYIRRKMNNFFDLTIVDEIHERATRYPINSNAAKRVA